MARPCHKVRSQSAQACPEARPCVFSRVLTPAGQRRARPRRAHQHARAIEKGQTHLKVREEHALAVLSGTPVLLKRGKDHLRGRDKHAPGVPDHTPVLSTGTFQFERQRRARPTRAHQHARAFCCFAGQREARPGRANQHGRATIRPTHLLAPLFKEHATNPIFPTSHALTVTSSLSNFLFSSPFFSQIQQSPPKIFT
ncbi:hypothetical protein JCGZ_10335 [Jatropha curcas]|uniref:Uncharacterized protein n=1 Tax=Jatropha curcas TaxID=180498 RepID=A0A067KVH3_JATCU|nr:hypothetical protein JCGZ_10335 [Jatropha curcas]